jgi:phosphoglycolate phosphatase-like HAD superfamily hydrolase
MARIQTLLVCLTSIFCITATAGAQTLPSWNDTPTKAAVMSFVEKVTQAGSPDFVRPEDRIAVFDNDGTLWTEQPMYTQLAFIIDRVKAMAPDHPEWKDKEPFKSLLAGDAKGVAASGQKGLLELFAATHAGMTTEAFEATVTDWLKTTKHPKFNRSYLECVYQPQIELLQYLRDNGFQTLIVSGGGIDFMRPWTQAVYGIPPHQVVGSSGKTKYEVRDGKAVIVKLPEIDFIDDKAGKPVAIHKFIGKRPILAFGNSDGDFEMLEYVTTGNGPRLGLILHHDDAEREAAYDRESHFGKLARGLDEAQARGWVLVSMKSDWAVVFPRK